MPLILFYLWGAIIIALVIPAVSHNWPVVLRNIYSVQYIPHLSVFMGNWMHGLAEIFTFIIYFVIADQYGCGLIAWIGGRKEGMRVKWYFSYPLGYGIISLILLGLLLTGLWFPVVLLSFSGFILIASLRLAIGARLKEISRDISEFFSGWGSIRWGVFLAAVFMLPAMFTPDVCDDAWEFYLAGPARWIYFHGYSIAGGVPPLNYPFIAELPYAFGLLWGNDSFGKILNSSVFICGIFAVLSNLNIREKAWGILLFLTSATGLALFTSGKNEGFLAGMVLLVWAASERPAKYRMGITGLLVGFALSVKYLAVLGLAWIPFCLILGKTKRRVGSIITVILVSSVVVLPWFMKSWIMTGDPLFPFLGGIFPSFSGWDEQGGLFWRYSFTKYAENMSTLSFVPTILTRESALLMLTMPLLFIRGGLDRVIAGVVMGICLVLGHFFQGPAYQRWVFPCTSILFVLSGRAISEILDKNKRAIAPLVIILSMTFMVSWSGLLANVNPIPYMLGSQDIQDYRYTAFRALSRAHSSLARVYSGGNIIMVGETKGYIFPGKSIFSSTRASGQAPLIWSLSRKSRTDQELKRYFKQLDAEWLVYNPYLAMRFADAEARYQWTPQKLALWRGYFYEHAELVEYPDEADQDNGVYYIYRLHGEPIPELRRVSLHLPGTEVLVSSAFDGALGSNGQLDSGSFRKTVEGVFPGIIQYRNSIGGVAMHAGDYQTAYNMFYSGFTAGAIDPWNLYRFGISAFRIGKWRDSISGMKMSYGAYPDRRRLILAMYCRIAFVAAHEGNGMSMPERIAALEDCIRAVSDGGYQDIFREEVGLLRLAKVGLLATLGQGMAAGLEYEEYQKGNKGTDVPAFNDLPKYLNAASLEAAATVH